eukprot:scaffold1291_cov256-Pinguiococcus_pyrenoidosus.AAC.2
MGEVDADYLLEAVDAGATTADFEASFRGASIVFAWNVQSANAQRVLAALKSSGDTAKAFLALESAADLEEASRLGGYRPAKSAPWDQVLNKEAVETYDLAVDLWRRRSSDDALYLLLLLGHVLAKPVPLIAMAVQQADVGAILCMCRNCFKEVVDCLTDPTCKAAIECLDACAANDQVASYRCITCNETPKLEAFSLCVLEKHNCLCKTAEAPEPIPDAMTHWRGKPLDNEAAEEILIGWLGQEGRQWSWMVHQGKNAAYDQFPCQHQIFYPGTAKKVAWYDPTFQVILPDGEIVWRRRHYRVRIDNKQAPGSYVFSVLDNGVTSNEQWRIVDVADDLSWIVFFYSGAARAAGQAYFGGLVCTPDGDPPPASEAKRIAAALQRTGIEPWEMYTVSNQGCADCGAPLGVEAKAVRQSWLAEQREAGKTIDAMQMKG